MTDACATTAPDNKSYSIKEAAIVIFWLAMGSFAIGVSEFAAMGLLPYFAADLGVSEEIAGHAISAYALGVVVGAPLITVIAARWPRKHVLIGLMAFYALGNGITTLANSMVTMDIARFISGLPHGAYFGIAMLFAADIVGKGNRAKAISYVIMGLAVATVIGVPAANTIGQEFGWRFGFGLVVIIAALASLMIWRTAPYKGPHPEENPLSEIGALKNKDVLLVLAMGAIGFGGMFSVFSYASAAFLETTNAPEWGVSFILMAYGLGTVIGHFIAGQIAGGRLLGTTLGFQLLLGASSAFYAFSIGNPWLIGLSLFSIGIGGGLVVPLQTRLMDVAGEAQTMAAAMNHAAFNLANALGPWLAGLALAAGYGWSSSGWVGVALTLGGVIIWAIIKLTDRVEASAQ